MVHFISSSLITLHQTDSHTLHIRDQLVFTLFIFVVSSPFWLFPDQTLQVIFFAAPWTSDVLNQSALCLRLLSLSLVLQALRMAMVSTMLKEKRTMLYGTMITAGGFVNVAICSLGANHVMPEAIPMLTLSGDVFLTIVLAFYFTKNGRIRW